MLDKCCIRGILTEILRDYCSEGNGDFKSIGFGIVSPSHPNDAS